MDSDGACYFVCGFEPDLHSDATTPTRGRTAVGISRASALNSTIGRPCDPPSARSISYRLDEGGKPNAIKNSRLDLDALPYIESPWPHGSRSSSAVGI